MKRRKGVWGVGAVLLVFALAVALILSGVGVSANSGNARPLVFATASPNQSLSSLVRGQLTELVTCTRACDATTTAYISTALAKTLGFSGVTPAVNYAIGSKTVRLQANKTTKVAVSVTATAKKRLANAGKRFQLTGRVLASPRTGSKQKEASVWFITVKT